MAQAVKQLFPEVRVAIGPAIEDGFYYDFLKATPFTPEDLERIEAAMREIVAADHKFVREEMSREEAIRFFEERGEPFKVEILRGIDAPTVSLYHQGDFVDLCRGPHVASTGAIKVFKLLSSSGRLLARGRAEPDAAAHLRHRVALPGGPRQVPLAPRGGQEARSPKARARARPVRVPRRRPGRPLLAAQRHGDRPPARGVLARGRTTRTATSRPRRRSW